MTLPLAPTTLMSITSHAGIEVPRWTPDGQHLLIASPIGGTPELWLVPAAGGAPRRITTAMGGVGFLGRTMPTISPDGRWVAAISERSGGGEVWLHPLEGGDAVQLTRLGAPIQTVGWSPDSATVVLSVRRFGTFDVLAVDVASGATTALTDDQRYEVNPVVTPDGEHVLFVRLDQRWVDHEIVSVPLAGGAQQVLATDRGMFDYHYGQTFGLPVPSPDGSRIVFRSHRSGWLNYWVIPADGGEPQPVAADEGDQLGAAWSPDGRHLAFTHNRNGTVELRVADTVEGGVRTILDPTATPAGMGVVEHPQFSPDGTQVSCLLSTPTSPADLVVVDLASGDHRRLTTSVPVGQEAHLVPPRKITYAGHEELEIAAYLYTPADGGVEPNGAGVVLVHGGPTQQWFDRLEPHAQFLVQRGYTVLCPNIRGSSGYGKAFEALNDGDWGHDDLGDVIAGARHLEGLEGVDPGQLAVMGTSYGGILSMAAVAFAPGVFKAAVPMSGYGDFVHMRDEQELRHQQLLTYELGPFEESEAVYRRSSPLYAVAQATTPCFVIHGVGGYPDSDAGRQFALALERHYKTFRYKTYPNENYYVFGQANVAEMLGDADDFIRFYLDLPGAPAAMPTGSATIPR